MICAVCTYSKLTNDSIEVDPDRSQLFGAGSVA